MEANQYIIDYYNGYNEEGRLTSRCGSVEFLTTMRYIEKYLKPGDRILEIGAATGRYSHALAKQGYTVNAVELVESQIEKFRQNTQPGENVTVTQGNALDLSEFDDYTYDIVLLLGPLYHLYNQDDKRQALSEAIRVANQGGVIFVAYCMSDGCILDAGFRRGEFDVAKFIERGNIDPQTFATKSKPEDLFELVRKEDIDSLMSVFEVTQLHYVATDGSAWCIREALDEMDDPKFDLFLSYHFAICEREDMIGISDHTLDIFRKD